MENAVDFFWDKNPLISWLSTVPKLSKILLFAGGLGLALGALHFAKHENAVLAKSALILFFTVGYLVWCVLIEAFFPKSLQGKVSAIVLVFILFAMVFNLVDSPFQYQNQVLI